jgi:hypothetical protein
MSTLFVIEEQQPALRMSLDAMKGLMKYSSAKSSVLYVNSNLAPNRMLGDR